MEMLGPAATLAPPLLPGSVPGWDDPTGAVLAEGRVPGAEESDAVVWSLLESVPNMALSTSLQLASPKAAAARISVKTRRESAILNICFVSARAV
jgi:hypothetical protein